MPIVNENDTIATDEIRYGDNDRLAANVAVMAGAGSACAAGGDVDSGPIPGTRSKIRRPRVSPLIEAITPGIEAMAGDAGSGLSKGGMKTKLMAAKTATAAGCVMAITEGSALRPRWPHLRRAPMATWFTATLDPQTARKAWISAMKPKGIAGSDAGAAAALGQGKPSSARRRGRCQWRFPPRRPGRDRRSRGLRLGLGLSRYTALEARAIAGHRSDEIEAILGYPGRAALIHRDDMAV